MTAANYYEILGIGPEADDDKVKQAYRDLAKTCHPDRNPGDTEAERRFKDISTAYEALKDAARRQSYNELLAFNEGQEKSERRQWSRLAAIILLLVLGPSAVLYGVLAFDNQPWAQRVHSMFVGTQAEQPEPRLQAEAESAPPANDVQIAEQEPPAVEEAATDAPKAVAALEAASVAAEPEVLSAEPATTPERQQEPEAEISARPHPAEPAAEPQTVIAEPNSAPSTSPAVEEAQPAPLEQNAPAQPETPAVAENPAEPLDKVEPEVQTAEIAAAPAKAEPLLHDAGPSTNEQSEAPNAEPEQQTQPGQQLAAQTAIGGVPEPQAVTPKPVATQSISRFETERSAEGEVKASAQLLARLKEPNADLPASSSVAPASLSPPSERNGLPPMPERRRRVLLENSYETAPDVEAFADCKSCPLMSARQSTSDVPVNFAISLGEITVAEWNVCVDDGVCAPYPIPDDNLATPVTGLTKKNAEAYAEWLSAITGKSYRIVAPSRNDTRQAQLDRCNGRALDGFDWLEGGPRRNCVPIVVPRNNAEIGFRVARRMNR